MSARDGLDTAGPRDPDRRGLRRAAIERQRGQGMVEYGLILILIAVVVIVVLGLLGHQVNNMFSNVSSQLGS